MKAQTKPFAVCIDNTNYQASLVPGKVYRIVPDARAAKDDLVRIVDESGEDYLYRKDHFVFVDFPPAAAQSPPPPSDKDPERSHRPSPADSVAPLRSCRTLAAITRRGATLTNAAAHLKKCPVVLIANLQYVGSCALPIGRGAASH